ncbi:MAG: hypothetical protein M3065_01790 [Actinomycetota bacterium]|nr:hypothetical protein [Actinomycetota bacterium]
MTIDGRPHGPGGGTTTCQVYMRQFEEGATISSSPSAPPSSPFTVAKITHPGHLPPRTARPLHPRPGHGRADGRRGLRRLHQVGECEAACPKDNSIRVIGRMNRDYLKGVLYHPRNARGGMKPQ